MKKLSFTIGIIITLLIMPSFSSAQSLKKMTKNIYDVHFYSTPETLEECGNMVTITITTEFPEKYFGKKCVMNITPTLLYDNGQTELPSISYIGEKVEGFGDVVDYKYGGIFTYSVSIPFLDDMSNCLLVIDPVIYKPKTKVHTNKKEIMEKEKFMACNTFIIGQGVITTAHNIDKKSLHKSKVMKHDVAIKRSNEIFFSQNSFKLNWQTGKNTEAYKDMTDISSIIKNSKSVKNIEINGWASPDGPAKFNDNLSYRRAKIIEKYIKDNYAKLLKDNDISITVKGNGPDWEGFMSALSKSTIREKDEIIKKLQSLNEDARADALKCYIKKYPEMANNILPKLRRTEVCINTIEEAPVSDNQAKAVKYNDLGIQAVYNNNYSEAEKYFIEAQRLGCNEDYNLGVINIIKGDYDKAVKLLTSGDNRYDYNIALAQTLDKEYVLAEETIKHIEEDGNIIYLKAIIAIRKDDCDMAIKMLKKAIMHDNRFKDMAKRDMEFISLQMNPEFIALTE
ncbi:MAG: TPR end-of-group domain-containing protein [Candidatus Limimorpha sp.]